MNLFYLTAQINDLKAKFVICVPETAEKVLKAVELSNFAQTTKDTFFSDNFEFIKQTMNTQSSA